MRRPIKKTQLPQAGFSLLELMVTILILIVVMAAVFSQINNLQSNTKSEAMKLDLTQESREFVDQFARDLHMSGYPAPKLYQNYGGIKDHSAASGLVFVSSTDVIFEGEVYGDGNVYRVEYKYFPNDPNDPACPCVRRSVTQKTAFPPGADPLSGYPNPVYYTEVQNVIDPTGMTEQLFTFFEADGSLVDVNSNACNAPNPLKPPPAPAAGCADIENDTSFIQQIDAIKVNLNTRSKEFDPQTHAQKVNSISSIAELEN